MATQIVFNPFTAKFDYSYTPDAVITGGTVGSSTQIPVITYDNFGRIIAVSTASPTATAATNYSDLFLLMGA